MKSINTFTKVALSVLTIAITVSGVTLASQSKAEPVVNNHVASESVVTPEPAPQPTPTTETEASPTTATPIASPEPVAQPAPVLSTDEYAAMHLDISSPVLKGCFDTIVATWPDRFSPELRERNVKALRAWATTCTSGINDHNGTIYQYGRNGEFFDSAVAIAQH